MTTCRCWKDRAISALLIAGSGMTVNGIVAERPTSVGISMLVAGLLWLYIRRHHWQTHRHVH